MFFTLCYSLVFKILYNMEKEEIEKILTEYYRKRKVIENSFGYKYQGTVEVRVKNLTKKYVDKLK